MPTHGRGSRPSGPLHSLRLGARPPSASARPSIAIKGESAMVWRQRSAATAIVQCRPPSRVRAVPARTPRDERHSSGRCRPLIASSRQWRRPPAPVVSPGHRPVTSHPPLPPFGVRGGGSATGGDAALRQSTFVRASSRPDTLASKAKVRRGVGFSVSDPPEKGTPLLDHTPCRRAAERVWRQQERQWHWL